MSGPCWRGGSAGRHRRLSWCSRSSDRGRVRRLRLGDRCRSPGRGEAAPTVSKWRDRFLSDRLDGLDDAPRLGQPRKLTDEQINALITRTLQDAPPSGDTHWSTRSMAADQGLNQTRVSRIGRAFGLKPHAVDSWKLSKTPTSSTRCATSSSCTCRPRTTPWSWPWMRNPRCRRWTGLRRSCP